MLTYERAQGADGVTIVCSLFCHMAKKVTLNGLFCFYGNKYHLLLEMLLSACVDHGLTYSCLMDSSSCLFCLSHEDLGCATAVTEERWMLEAGISTHQTRNPTSSYRLFCELFL